MTAPTVDTPTDDEAIAKRIAARAVQSLADSEPDEDTIEAQDRLKGTPQESLFVVSAEVLEAFIAVAISNAVYDGELGSPAALLAARREVETGEAVKAEYRETMKRQGETSLALAEECNRLRTEVEALRIANRDLWDATSEIVGLEYDDCISGKCSHDKNEQHSANIRKAVAQISEFACKARNRAALAATPEEKR